MEWKLRHQAAITAARRACHLEASGQIVIAVIVAIAGIGVLWLWGGPNEAWSEVLLRSGLTAAILVIFPVVYAWHFLGLGPLAKRKARMLIIAGLSGIIISASIALAGTILFLRAPQDSDKKFAHLQTQLDSLVTTQKSLAQTVAPNQTSQSGPTTAPDPALQARINGIATQIDRIARIERLNEVIGKVDELVAKLPETATTQESSILNPMIMPGYTSRLNAWNMAVGEIERIYKDYFEKPIDLKSTANFDRNPYREMPGDDRAKTDAIRWEYRKFMSQKQFADGAVRNMQGEMRGELARLKTEAYSTRLGVSQ